MLLAEEDFVDTSVAALLADSFDFEPFVAKEQTARTNMSEENNAINFATLWHSLYLLFLSVQMTSNASLSSTGVGR